MNEKIEAFYRSVVWEIYDIEGEDAEDIVREFQEDLERAYSGDKKAFERVMDIVKTYEPFYGFDKEENEAIEILRKKVRQNE